MSTAISGNQLISSAATLPRPSYLNSTVRATAGEAEAAPPESIREMLGRVDLLFASAEEEQAFAVELTRRLQAAGVDTSQPIELTVKSDGSVTACRGAADKAKIDAVFAADPAFANEYRKISNTRELQAVADQYQAYSAAYSAAASDSARDEVWQRYSGSIAAIGTESGNLTLAGGRFLPSAS